MSMGADSDLIRTVLHPSPEVLYKERKSKFFGYALPLASEEEAAELLEGLRKKHRNPSHLCYAWRLGEGGLAYRAYDDGEPTHTAGTPILGQLQAFEITNVLLAVVRIYGGTKLGTGGLANAYRTAARMALEASEIVILHEVEYYAIGCPYEAMDKVLKTLRGHGIKIISQEIDVQCRFAVEVKKQEEGKFRNYFSLMNGVTLVKTEI